MKLVLGITGASGVVYGLEFLKACHKMGVETHLVISEWAKNIIEMETRSRIEDVKKLSAYVHDNDNLAAPISSGSFKHDGMAIIPCSMKSLAAVSCGYTESLMSRAADVTIKEGRKLLLMVRETPLNAIHLENMLKLARLGVIIAPPVPAMYAQKTTVQELVMQTVARMLDHFGIETDFAFRWQGPGIF